ncbi:hypothetical protein BJX64DRAFT_294395 [Aspergillus heterothallicus]
MQFTMKALATVIAVLVSTTAATPIRNAPQCRVGTAWPDTSDCHKFYECAAGGIAVRKSCGPGTAYSPATGVCDFEWKVKSCGKVHAENNAWQGRAHGHGNRHSPRQDVEEGKGRRL